MESLGQFSKLLGLALHRLARCPKMSVAIVFSPAITGTDGIQSTLAWSTPHL